jgi:putative transposase
LTTRANGYIESFHGRFREECLNEHWFLTLDDARETIEFWRIDYNRVRPYKSLGYRTPEEFAKGYANVESKKRFPHLHSLDGCCGLNMQLNSNRVLSLTRIRRRGQLRLMHA